MTLASNALSADVTFTAGTDGIMEGWESIVFTPVLGNVEIVFDYGARFMAFVRENVPNPERLPHGDYDLDGLPDRWELAHGLDPFTPGEALLDPDPKPVKRNVAEKCPLVSAHVHSCPMDACLRAFRQKTRDTVKR